MSGAVAEPVAAALAGLWALAGGEAGALDLVALTGEEPALPGPFKIGTAASATIAAAGLSAAELWRQRTGRSQAVRVDMRHAAAAFRSERYLRVAGRPAADLWSPISGFYQAGDGRWIQLHCNFPHHRDGVLRILGAPPEREAVAEAIGRWRAADLDTTLGEAGLCAALVRTPDEWRDHAQARAVARLPLLEIVPLGDGPREAVGQGDRPLRGVRVLDLTRIIAGPVAGRTLAEHGAEVLLVTGRHLPSIEPLVIDTGRGKLATHLDLRHPDQAERLRELVRTADVFVQGYRPGALAARGFSPEELARLRPGLVVVTLSAYGHDGPWRERRGFDSLVQSASGIAHEGGVAAGLDRPRHLPAQALDHATGYLAAFGAMMALLRRAREGGSWLVRLSLAQTGRWLDGLGRLTGADSADPGLEAVADLLEVTPSGFGLLSGIRPAAQFGETPARWARPAVPLGTHPAVWPAVWPAVRPLAPP